MSIWKYASLLPDIPVDCRISLGEGSTPLIRSRRIGPDIGLPNLYFKLETANPTGSYKDRFAACAVSDLQRRKSRLCLATSSGNTGAALAAYCAAADIPCFIAVVEGAPEGKLRQMQVYGARLFKVRHFGHDEKISAAVFDELKRLADKHKAPVQISAYKYSPIGMSGVQTIAYELAEQLSEPDVQVFSPAGGGGLTLAVALGFHNLAKIKPEFLSPKVHCVQPTGNDTIAGPLRRGEPSARAVSNSATQISGLQVPNLIDGDEVVKRCRESGGTGHLVSDEAVWEAQRLMASCEGIYCEPAGAVALAGALSALKNGVLNAHSKVVCLVTGTGFKDPVSTEKMAGITPCPMLGRPEDIAGYLE